MTKRAAIILAVVDSANELREAKNKETIAAKEFNDLANRVYEKIKNLL